MTASFSDTPPKFLKRAGRPSLAYRTVERAAENLSRRPREGGGLWGSQALRSATGPRLRGGDAPGADPTLVFLPGYASDMTGDKASAVAEWAKAKGCACLRFDYAGCGASQGDFEAETVETWLGDTLDAVDALAPGPLILIGSSMGGWLALLAAMTRPARVAAVVGIAAAPDFTDWGFTLAEKDVLTRDGRLVRTSEYGEMVTTEGFWTSGERNRLLGGTIPLDCPVRLLHGQRDDVVPWDIATRTAALIRSDDVQVSLVKDGDHRLSRLQDIALLTQTLSALTES